jgi:hypothetical protein
LTSLIYKFLFIKPSKSDLTALNELVAQGKFTVKERRSEGDKVRRREGGKEEERRVRRRGEVPYISYRQTTPSY